MNKPRLERVPIEKLVQDFRFYPRTSVSSTHVTAMLYALESGAVFPPLRVTQDYRIIDGFHRYDMYKRHGDTEVSVQVEHAADDAEFYLRAVEANSTHGRPYVPFEYKRIISMAEGFGLSTEKIANVLHITAQRATDIRRGFAVKVPNGVLGGTRSATSAEGVGVPLKGSVMHLAGKQVSATQAEVIEHKLTGMNALFLVNQLLLMMDHNLLDMHNQGLTQKLGELATRINEVLPTLVAGVV